MKKSTATAKAAGKGKSSLDQQAHRLHQRELDATKSGTSSATPRTTPRVRTASQSKRNYSIKQNQKNSGKNTSKYFKRRSEHRVMEHCSYR